MLKMAKFQNNKESFNTFLDPDNNLEHHQNILHSSLSHSQHFLQIPLRSVHNFSSYFAKRQKDKWLQMAIT